MARHRAFVIVPVVLVAIAGIAVIIAGLSELTSMRPGMAVMILPGVGAAPIYLGVERRFRRAFRRKGQLPRGRLMP